ncbi:MAG: hypothetical protein ACRD2Q_03565 [Terriglobales bacterium]
MKGRGSVGRALNRAHESERCQHYHLTGRRCGSPALTGHRLCYYHQQTRRPKLPDYKLPLLEDAVSVQFGLVQVARALEDKAYDAKTGALLLYALQTASANLKRVQDEREYQRRADEQQKAGSSMSTESFADIMIRGLGLRELDPPTPQIPNSLQDELVEDFQEDPAEGPNEETDHRSPGANAKPEPTFDEMFPKDPPTRRGPVPASSRPAGTSRRRGSA